MRDQQECSNCKFWVPEGNMDAEGKVDGRCKRYPPRPWCFFGEEDPEYVQPFTMEDEWCGEWVKHPAKR